MNTCKSKRLMWRLNKGLAKELLPSAPRDIRMEPWWRVCVVNVGEHAAAAARGPWAGRQSRKRCMQHAAQPTCGLFWKFARRK